MTQSHSNTSCCCRNKFRAFKNSCVPSYTRTSYIPSLSHKFVLKNISDYLISVNNFLIFIMYNHKSFLKKLSMVPNVNNITIQQNKFFHMKYFPRKKVLTKDFHFLWKVLLEKSKWSRHFLCPAALEEYFRMKSLFTSFIF